MSWCNSVPAPTILFCLLWSYYAYVVVLCVNTITEKWKQSLYLTVYHVIFIMLIWCYFKTMCAVMESVPDDFKFSKSFFNIFKDITTEATKNNILISFCSKRKLDLVTRTITGNIRFCNICENVKPDRAHHCSKCETCILRMDHHCPWVDNCVGFSNYKYFILFLSYGALYCSFFALTTFEYFINFFEHPTYYQLHTLVGFLLSASLSIILTPFIGYHMMLISKNKTTLEHLDEPIFRDKDLTFNINVRTNFTVIFGKRCFLWFIPVWSTLGDGINYPCRYKI